MSRVLPLGHDVPLRPEPGAHLPVVAVRARLVVQDAKAALGQVEHLDPLDGIADPAQQQLTTIGRPVPQQDLPSRIPDREILTLPARRIPQQRSPLSRAVAHRTDARVVRQRRESGPPDAALLAVPELGQPLAIMGAQDQRAVPGAARPFAREDQEALAPRVELLHRAEARAAVDDTRLPTRRLVTHEEDREAVVHGRREGHQP